jgi:4-diphosphocytidyl-2-C-methyl-D-erythritol kinase
MDYVRIKAYAKINLSLDILGRENGYHMLDSVVTTIDIYDLITLKKRKKDKNVTISMHGLDSESIPYEKNNAVIAAEKFIKEFDTNGVDIVIYKNIPMGAGLGGSSADVAGVLNGLKKLYLTEDADVKPIADSIGSDCGYMLSGGYARIFGRGEKVQPIDTHIKLDLVLLIPQTPVSTAACYAMFDKINCRHSQRSDNVIAALLSSDRVALGRELGNSLTPPAICLNEDVGEAITCLHEFAPLGVNMSGSGSCVYALCENEQFCSYIISRYGGKFKILQTKTYIPKRGKNNGRGKIN